MPFPPRSRSLAIVALLCFWPSLSGLAQDAMPVDRLAEALARAQTDEERQALLTAESHLVTVELRQSLVKRGQELKTRGSHPPPAEALRSAARQMLQKAPCRHPFYWAGFIVMGDGS